MCRFRSMSRWPLLRGAAALDVDDVGAVEHCHVDGAPGLVAQRLEVGDGELAQVHRVDRGESEVEDARPQPVLPRGWILLEVAERGERRDVAVGRRAAQADLTGEVADSEQRAAGAKRRENREPTLERLRVGAAAGSRLHPGVLTSGTASRHLVLRGSARAGPVCAVSVNALLFEAMDGAGILRTKIVGAFARPRQR